MAQFAPLIGLALSAAGTGVGMAAAAAARSDANKAIANQVAAQQKFQQQASAVVQPSIEQSGATTAENQIEAGRRAAEEMYQKVGALPTTASYNPIPLDQAAQQRVQASVGQQARSQAASQGYKDWGLQQWLKNMDVNRQLGTINTLSAGSAQAAPTLAQLAAGNSANMAGMGSLLSTAGGLAGLYAAVNPGFGLGVQTQVPKMPANRGYDSMPLQIGQA